LLPCLPASCHQAGFLPSKSTTRGPPGSDLCLMVLHLRSLGPFSSLGLLPWPLQGLSGQGPPTSQGYLRVASTPPSSRPPVPSAAHLPAAGHACRSREGHSLGSAPRHTGQGFTVLFPPSCPQRPSWWRCPAAPAAGADTPGCPPPHPSQPAEGRHRGGGDGRRPDDSWGGGPDLPAIDGVRPGRAEPGRCWEPPTPEPL
jgi:hypothetical protein